MKTMRLALLCAFAAGSGCECVDGGTPRPPEKSVPRNTDPLTTALESEARRLTRAEVDRTLAQALLDDGNAGERLLPRDAFTPFDNNYVDQLSSAALVDALEALSVDVAVRTLADPGARAAVIPCTPAIPGDAACFAQVIDTVGRRLLRRPLDDAERATYGGLLTYATEESPYYATGFDAAVEVLLRALLMDPEFLFRIEVGTPLEETGVVRLNPWETATRMSFALWGAGPDDALLDAAGAGTLDDSEGRAQHAALMLEDERARAQLRRFHAMWLGYQTMPVSPELASAFATESAALLDRVIFEEDRDYLDVFRLEETFLDDALADHYGLPRPTTSPGWVSLAGTDRAGLLSQGTVLSSFSKVGDTSPTQRGILVRGRLMCLPIDPPPPNVVADQPPPATADAICKSDRYAAHMNSSTSCFACHSLMDPIGFGLENYNIQGQFREHDDGLPECTIEGSGELPGYGTFRGPRELSQKLIDNDLIEPCFLRQMATFQTGRPLIDGEGAVVDAWRARFDASGRKLEALLLEQIGSEQFVTRREPGVQP